MSSCRKSEIYNDWLKSPKSSEFAIFLTHSGIKILNYVYFMIF